MQNFQSGAHIIFYIRLRLILIISAAFHAFDIQTILLMCSGLVIKTLSKLHEETFGVGLEKLKFY
jgi:hypothetical protein